MRFLDKLLKRNQVKEQVVEQEFAKADIFLYGEIMDEPTLKDDNNYVIAGCFNKDETKFKNLLTGEVYDCELQLYVVANSTQTGHYFDRMQIGDKVYGQIRKYRKKRILYGGDILYIDMLRCGEFDWMGALEYGKESYDTTSRKWWDYPLEKKMKPVFEFVEKESFEAVKLSEIKSVTTTINEHARQVISQKLDNKKQLEDLRSAGYNKF